jgi:hypothetical protein
VIFNEKILNKDISNTTKNITNTVMEKPKFLSFNGFFRIMVHSKSLDALQEESSISLLIVL